MDTLQVRLTIIGTSAKADANAMSPSAVFSLGALQNWNKPDELFDKLKFVRSQNLTAWFLTLILTGVS